MRGRIESPKGALIFSEGWPRKKRLEREREEEEAVINTKRELYPEVDFREEALMYAATASPCSS